MRYAPALIAACLLSASAGAANWVRVSKPNEVIGVFVDDSEPLTGGEYQRRWVKMDYRHDKTEKARSGLYRMLFNCTSRTIATEAWVRYRADGGVIESWDGYGPARPVIPDSIGETAYTYACAHRLIPDDTIQLQPR